jgi:hypothetical protein
MATPRGLPARELLGCCWAGLPTVSRAYSWADFYRFLPIFSDFLGRLRPSTTATQKTSWEALGSGSSKIRNHHHHYGVVVLLTAFYMTTVYSDYDFFFEDSSYRGIYYYYYYYYY